jgi:hypothetical protein
VVRFVVLLLLNLCTLSSMAETQPLSSQPQSSQPPSAQSDVYRVETWVANQSEVERTSATKATLGDVILKITGDAAVLQHPLILQAIREAPNYLLRFNYATERDSKLSADATKPTETVSGRETKLVLHYSPKAITQLLREAQLLLQPQQQGLVRIQITHVQDFTAFKQIQAYLKTVNMIRHSELLSANKDILLFNITVEGNIDLLKSTLDSNPKWQALDAPITDAQALPAQPSQLNFRWQNPS